MRLGPFVDGISLRFIAADNLLLCAKSICVGWFGVGVVDQSINTLLVWLHVDSCSRDSHQVTISSHVPVELT
jgi:hypothetical protein